MLTRISTKIRREKRQATCHKEVMADKNVRPPLTLVPAQPDQGKRC